MLKQFLPGSSFISRTRTFNQLIGSALAVLTVDIKSNTFQMESKQGREPSGNEDFNHALNRKQAATNEFLSVQQPLNSNKIY